MPAIDACSAFRQLLVDTNESLMPDTILAITIASSFALMVTSHAAIFVGLVRRRMLFRALTGLIFPPLAPFWSHLANMKVRCAFWLFATPLYVASVLIALSKG